jgi:hypothetical protein
MEVGKVYVIHNEWIQDPETGNMPYKIGITKGTIENRFYGLGLRMPGEFVCDFAYEFGENYAKVEKTLHNMLNQLNVNGEWFNVNEEALEGIKDICELSGGKLITEKIVNEIEKETDSKNDDFEKIIEKWNSESNIKASGNSPRKRGIYLKEIDYSVYYVFRLRNSKELSIELGCWTNKYPNFDKFLLLYDRKNINRQIFHYPKLNKREIKLNYKGKIRTILPLSDIDTAIETMKKFILETKENVIEECNKK